jgi:hypothetical protein
LFRIVTCDSFPQKPWIRLTAQQREQLIGDEPAIWIPLLALERILDSFKRMVAKARAEGSSSVVPLLHLGRRSYVLFPVDYGRPKTHPLKMLAALLEEPQSMKRFKEYSKSMGGEAKDRLKDLAVLRLYQHCGNDWGQANDFADAHRKKTSKGKARPFHSAQRERTKNPIVSPPDGSEQQQEDSKTSAPLCSEQSGFLKAKQRVKAYARKLFPWEHFQQDEAEMLQKAQARITRAYAEDKARAGIAEQKEKEKPAGVRKSL